MPLSEKQVNYFISYAVAFLVFGLVAKWYLWPAIKDRVDRTYLGVSYYLAALNVPAMIVVHVLIFAYLPRRGVAQ